MVTAAHAMLAEFNAEVPATRRVLERMPADRFDWQPHPRSMSAGQLGRHVASIPATAVRLAAMDGFDVANAPAVLPSPENRDELLGLFERSIVSMRELLAGLDDGVANAPWKLTFGGREVQSWSRLTMIRTIGFNHWYHHRGELVVYLRLLGVPVPVVYGRSADENPFAHAPAAAH